jgi:hypothetical protein
MAQLDDEGHAVNFHDSKWKVSTGARILAHEYKTRTLYMTTNIRDIVAVANASADLKTWAYELEGDASAFVQGKTTKTKIT